MKFPLRSHSELSIASQLPKICTKICGPRYTINLSRSWRCITLNFTPNASDVFRPVRGESKLKTWLSRNLVPCVWVAGLRARLCFSCCIITIVVVVVIGNAISLVVSVRLVTSKPSEVQFQTKLRCAKTQQQVILRAVLVPCK